MNLFVNNYLKYINFFVEILGASCVFLDEKIETVNVGSISCPMEEKHFIEWVYLQPSPGGHKKSFKPGNQPLLSFSILDDILIAVYAYCNYHGL